jgi:hypothetical protein
MHILLSILSGAVFHANISLTAVGQIIGEVLDFAESSNDINRSFLMICDSSVAFDNHNHKVVSVVTSSRSRVAPLLSSFNTRRRYGWTLNLSSNDITAKFTTTSLLSNSAATAEIFAAVAHMEPMSVKNNLIREGTVIQKALTSSSTIEIQATTRDSASFA